MTPEMWARLKELFSQAIEKEGGERERFLETACGGDLTMLEALRGLIAGHEGATDFPSLLPAVHPHADDDRPMFHAGEALGGRFRIIRFLARGGMGEVYEAEDLVLNQKVALKTIQRALSASRGVEILKQEIHSARRVTHPNICRIYDIAEHPERQAMFLTMELLEGPTLSQFIREHGPLSREQAYPLIKQIAAGLQAAHDAGVIHRDFKPGNVILTGEPGAIRAVITDFGLALTPQSRMADAELRAGTPGYMAPEQVHGAPATPATDVYAFGAVIAAMTGARRTGPSGGFIEDWKRLGPWRGVVGRCLAPDPAERFQRPSEVLRSLRGAGSWLRLAPIAGAAAVLAAGVVLLQTWSGPGPAEGFVNRRIADEPAEEMFWGNSPDGRWLVASDWKGGQLVLRETASGRTRPLTHPQTPRAAPWYAVFSPDAKTVACTWRTEGNPPELRAVDVSNGRVRALLNDISVARADPAAWSRDGSRIAVWAEWKDGRSGLGVLSVADGQVRPVATNEQAQAAAHVVFAPSGNELIFDAPQSRDARLRDIFAVPIGEPATPRALIGGAYDQYLVGLTPDGERLVFVSDESGVYGIWTAPLGPGLMTGKPSLALAASGRIEPVGITRNGTLYYKIDLNFRKVFTAAFDVVSRSAGAARELGLGMFPAFSPGGELSYLDLRDPARPVLAFWSPATHVSRHVTVDLGVFERPQWRSRDTIVGIGSGQGREGFFEVDPRTGRSRWLEGFAGMETAFEGAWAEGGAVWYNRFGQHRRGIFRFDFRTKRRDVIFVPGPSQDLSQENLALSPDGRTLAFQIRERPKMDPATVMLLPVSGGGPRPLLTIGRPERFRFGAFAWLPDSSALLMARGNDNTQSSELWLVPVNGAAPERIDFPNAGVLNLRISPDGRHLAYFSSAGERSELRALENFLPR